MFVLLPSSCPIIFQISRAVFPVLAQAIRQFVNRHKKLLLLVKGFDCVLLDVAIQRSDIELQRTTDLEAGDFPQPGLSVDCVHFEIEVLGSLPDIQAPSTAYFVGALIAIFYPVGAPLSGMSTNPARSFGPAAQADCWHALWIYFIAPSMGMLAAAETFLGIRRDVAPYCAKLHHANDKRCIFHHTPQLP